VYSKEIDSKQDLQQEESAQLPAEHRSFPNHSPHLPQTVHPHHSHHAQSGQTPDTSSGDPWPLGRPDVSQIKVSKIIFILYFGHFQ
jgi:hypothetical protein